MYSNGRLPSQHDLEPLLEHSSIRQFFGNSSLTPWVAGSWNDNSKVYRDGNDTVNNVMTSYHNFGKVRHGYISL